MVLNCFQGNKRDQIFVSLLQWRTEAMEWELQLIKMANQGHSHIKQIYIYTTRRSV